MNNVVLAGRVGGDPKTNTRGGTIVSNFGIATDRFVSGGGKGDPDWHNVVCFGKTAENVAKYVKKGSYVLVIGSIKYSKWDDSEGVTHYKTEIIADRVEFGPRTSAAEPAPSDEPDEDIPF